MNGVVTLSAAIEPIEGLALATMLLLVAWLAPNTQELIGYVGPSGAYSSVEPERRLRQTPWRPNLRWAMAVGAVFGAAVLSLSRVSEFLYFQF
jgi:alginate O-acetyltransferase complex protein AlgI